MYLTSGFDTEGLCPAVWPGGETEALNRIEKQFGKDSSSVNICHISHYVKVIYLLLQILWVYCYTDAFPDITHLPSFLTTSPSMPLIIIIMAKYSNID